MIEWFKQRNREKRHLIDKKKFSLAISYINKSHYLRQLDKLEQAILDGNQEEIKNRGKVFTSIGIIAPTTLQGCEKLTRDIKLWRP